MIAFRRGFLLFLLFSGAVQTVCAQGVVSLDCTFREGNGIFAPGQSVILDVTLRLPPSGINPSVPIVLHATLTNVSQPDRPTITQFNTQIPPNAPLPISFVTPDKEGVYEIGLVANREAKPNRISLNLIRSVDLYLTETRQFVVLTPQMPRLAGDWTLTDKRTLPLAPEDRLNMAFRFNDSPSRRLLPTLPHLPKPPISLPKFSAFGRQNSSEESPEDVFYNLFGDDTLYALSLETEVGKPYLVEMDYPVNVPQTLKISIVDDEKGVNAAAAIHVAEEIVQDTPTETVATHQFLFWAETENPKLMLVNRQPNQEPPQNIRISQVTTSGQQDDTRLPKLFAGTAQRKRIGQISLSYSMNRDWQKAYEGCSRLLDTLSRGGYDGVTLTVLSKDSALCPMASVHGDDGKEIIDNLEMMFRRFDNEGLTLIPAIEFNMPIPSLELLAKQYPAIIEEIYIGNPAECWYNLLHPAVQQAMAAVVGELVDRFSAHPSFGGVAIVLSPQTYAQLPFAPIPPDDHTWMLFRQDTEQSLGIAFPDEQQLRQTMPIQQFLAQKSAERIRFLNSDDKRIWSAWVRWRAAKVSGFYADLAKQVSERAGDVSPPVYLLGGTMLDHPAFLQFCAPTLPQNFASLQALQLIGFDLQLISKAESLRFLRPVQISETKNYCYDGLNSVDAVGFFTQSGVLPGVQFVHTGDIVAGSLFVTTPAHIQSRKRFVQQLAQADVLMFMDGGVSLPFGQESAMFDLLDTYRRLPPMPFQTFETGGLTSPAHDNVSLQPLTVRYKNLSDKTIVYIVNDAPFAVEADFLLSVGAKSTMTELTGHRMIRSLSRYSGHLAGTPSHSWRVSLAPYDLLAIQINDANAKIESVSVHCPPSLCGAEGVLRRKVEELAHRIHSVRSGAASDGLVNADFELPLDTEGRIVGWACFGNSLTAQLDRVAVGKGQSSVKLTNHSEESGTFLSQPLSIPVTGRLGVSMLVGVPADCQSLPMNVVLTATHRGEPFQHHMPVGETLMPHFANVEPKNGVRWYRLLVPFERERLPLESLEEIRIGIGLTGTPQHLAGTPGPTIWLDDITIHQALFSANEVVELQKMLVVADQRCSSGRYSDLISLLDGYWSQFLFQQVHASAPQPKISTPAPSVANEASPPKPTTMYQRMRGWFL